VITGHFTEAVEVVRPGATTDRYGNRVADWTATTRTTTYGWIEQTAASENAINRDGQAAEWLLLCRADVEISGSDRIEYSGLTFEVIGPPAIRRTPRGNHHQEVRLRWVNG
jgi:head-tail adaptor